VLICRWRKKYTTQQWNNLNRNKEGQTVMVDLKKNMLFYYFFALVKKPWSALTSFCIQNFSFLRTFDRNQQFCYKCCLVIGLVYGSNVPMKRSWVQSYPQQKSDKIIFHIILRNDQQIMIENKRAQRALERSPETEDF